MEYTFCVSSEYIDAALWLGVDLQAPSLQGDTHTAAPYASVQPLGFAARPRDPDDNGAAGALYFTEGGVSYVLPTHDPRGLAKTPPLKPGGSVQYSYPGGFLMFDGENGSLLALVPNEDASKNHAISVDSAAGAISIIHAEGAALNLLNDTKRTISLTSANGQVGIFLDNDGIALNGNTKGVGSLVVGDIELAEAVPLYAAWHDWATTITQVAAACAAFVNGLAPGTVDPVTLGLLTVRTAALASLGKSLTLSASALPTP